MGARDGSWHLAERDEEVEAPPREAYLDGLSPARRAVVALDAVAEGDERISLDDDLESGQLARTPDPAAGGVTAEFNLEVELTRGRASCVRVWAGVSS